MILMMKQVVGQSMNLWQVFTIQQTSIEPIDSTTVDQCLENGQVLLRSFCNDPVDMNGVHIISAAPMKSLRRNSILILVVSRVKRLGSLQSHMIA